MFSPQKGQGLSQIVETMSLSQMVLEHSVRICCLNAIRVGTIELVKIAMVKTQKQNITKFHRDSQPPHWIYNNLREQDSWLHIDFITSHPKQAS